MKVIIPAGSQLTRIKGKTIETKIEGTDIWLIGEQLPSKKWNVYTECKESNQRETIAENTTTVIFNALTNICIKNTLNFNFTGKKNKLKSFSNFLKKFIKTNY